MRKLFFFSLLLFGFCLISATNAEKSEPTIKQESFLHYTATEHLRHLAKKPFDLTLKENLTDARLRAYVAESAGIKLFYGTERVDDKVLEVLFSLAKEADVFEKTKKMHSGAIVNAIEGYESENLPALHTQLRDIFEDMNTNETAKKAALSAKNEVEKLKTFIEKIEKEDRITDLIMIGIGGSDLGPRAVYYALEGTSTTGRVVHFISNVDPDDATRVLCDVDLQKAMVAVISKTGTTLETLTNEEILRAAFKAKGIDDKNRFLAVTKEKSPMDNPERYAEVFHLWDYIGGRYSVTSVAGGLPLAFGMGFETYLSFLKGAHAMDKASLEPDLNKNLPLLGALLSIWNHNFLHHPTLAIIPYSDALRHFPAHVEQVLMESDGKRIDTKGHVVKFQTQSVVWGEPGTNAQHSFFQEFHQGTQVVPVEFIGFLESQRGKDLVVKGSTSQEKLLANLFAQSIALAAGKESSNPNKVFPGNKMNRILFAKKLTPEIVGALASYYENVTTIQGIIWGINSFDQEGVQLGKVTANRLIEIYANKREGKAIEGELPLGNTYISLTEAMK